VQCVAYINMPKGRKRSSTQAGLEERSMKRIDRAVKRYGATAVAKYYSPPAVSRLSRFAGETKYFDTYFTQTVDTAADWGSCGVSCSSYMNADGSTVSAYTDQALIPSATGSGNGQVVGSKYIIKKLKVRGEVLSQVSSDSADALPATTVRLMLVQDTQPNGGQALISTMLTDWGTAGQNQFSYQAISSGGGGRFKILYDKIFHLSPAMMGTDGTNTNTQIQNSRIFQITKSWKKGLKTVIKNGASTPAVAQLSDNNIFLVAHSSGLAPCIIRGNARCCYVD